MTEPRGIDITQDADFGRAVRIIWIDSGVHRDRGWSKIDGFLLGDDEKTMRVETVGLWMGESDHVVAVAQSRDLENNNWMAAQVVYKPCVVTKEWLS